MTLSEATEASTKDLVMEIHNRFNELERQRLIWNSVYAEQYKDQHDELKSFREILSLRISR